jgi:c(7)-type cytochrome triheme protein
LGKRIVRKYEFKEFVKGWPRERLGNGVDWEKAEKEGKITPVDFLEGVSIKRDKLVVQKDFELGAKTAGMPNIIFSHQKHTIWNGCELCHPEIFIGIKKGITKYSMVELYEGKYCGVCHNNVAFPLLDCQRCHTDKVQ